MATNIEEEDLELYNKKKKTQAPTLAFFSGPEGNRTPVRKPIP